MAKSINIEIRAKKNENIDRMIKRFSKKVKKERIIEDARERAFYEKPSEKKSKLKKRRKATIEKLNKEKEETN